MNTATVTWIAYENYGTYLQAYALQQILRKLGHENHIIYDSYFAKYVPDKIPFFKRVIQFIKFIVIGKHHYTHFRFKLFEKQYLSIEYNVTVTDGLGDKYDVFICGSDQIWSPYLDFEPFYFLGFKAKKKIAYAPSIGTDKFTKQFISRALPLIKDFDFISTREKVISDSLSMLIGRDVETVVDPTLLLLKADWMKLIKCVNMNHYLLCYFLTPNEWYINIAKDYSKKKKLKLVVFSICPKCEMYADTIIYAGPKEFLSYIMSADMIFTDSFHASIFSLIFQKSFVAFKRFEDGKDNDQNSRFYNLFDELGIKDHFVEINNVEKVYSVHTIDWNSVNNQIEILRRKSISYLKKALSTNGKDM